MKEPRNKWHPNNKKHHHIEFLVCKHYSPLKLPGEMAASSTGAGKLQSELGISCVRKYGSTQNLMGAGYKDKESAWRDSPLAKFGKIWASKWIMTRMDYNTLN